MMTDHQPFLLSNHGSNRGTAYPVTNKSVSLAGRTHVVWLDAVATISGRTYDHRTATWSQTWRWFDGCDNHSNPALSADADGHLHLAYGSHGFWGQWNQGRFRHVVSVEPNDMTAWEHAADVGYGATYASLVTDAHGRDCLAYRGGEAPPAVMFQRQRDNGGWTQAKPLLHQEIPPQYTHVGASIVSDANGILYAGGHFYNLRHNAASIGVAVLRSADHGATWCDMRGEAIVAPATYTSRIAAPHPACNPYMGGLVVDPANRLWCSTYSPQGESTEAPLSCWENGAWRTVDLAGFIPDGWFITAANACIDTAGRVHAVVDAVYAADGAGGLGGKAWGHAATEVFHLLSVDDGRTFTATQVSTPDPTTANWLGSISRPSPHHPVTDPVILYTHGHAHAAEGQGCKATHKTEIFAVLTTSDTP